MQNDNILGIIKIVRSQNKMISCYALFFIMHNLLIIEINANHFNKSKY